MIPTSRGTRFLSWPGPSPRYLSLLYQFVCPAGFISSNAGCPAAWRHSLLLVTYLTPHAKSCAVRERIPAFNSVPKGKIAQWIIGTNKTVTRAIFSQFISVMLRPARLKTQLLRSLRKMLLALFMFEATCVLHIDMAKEKKWNL